MLLNSVELTPKTSTLNSHKSNTIPLIFQLLSIPEPTGQTVNPSKKSEINPLVDLAGLSEPLKPCPIDSVSLQDKKTKPESLLKIYLPVVLHVETDVTEDSHLPLGNITNLPVSFPEVFMETPNTAKPTPCPHVPTTSTLKNTPIAHLTTLPPLAVNNAPHLPDYPGTPTSTTEVLLIPSKELKTSKKKS